MCTRDGRLANVGPTDEIAKKEGSARGFPRALRTPSENGWSPGGPVPAVVSLRRRRCVYPETQGPNNENANAGNVPESFHSRLMNEGPAARHHPVRGDLLRNPYR
jgi:hypothetical protein